MGQLKTKGELEKRHIEIWDQLDQIEKRAQNEKREMTAEEAAQYDALLREDVRNQHDMQFLLTSKQLEGFREQQNKNAQFRELLKRCKDDRKDFSAALETRETPANTVLKDPTTGNTTGNLEAAGLVPLVVHELIDTKVPGLELPGDVQLITGVTGDEIYPLATDDVTVKVAGEVEQVSAQTINFDKITAHAERVAARVDVSNRAIDNAAFDLLGFVTYKIRKALAMTNALHIYSHCAFNHALKSPFAMVNVEEVVFDENIGENIAIKIAEMWDLGFEGEPWITMDKTIETQLRFTKAIPDSEGNRTVIEDGKCVGYNYTVSPYINYALNSEGKPAPDGNHYIGIGHWDYLPFQQHGEARLTVDAVSAAVAERNVTAVVFSADLSLTELSNKVNGNKSGKPQAFKLLKLVNPTE